MLDRALAIEPNNLDLKAQRAAVELNWKADTRPLHQLLDSIRATNPGDLERRLAAPVAPWPNTTLLLQEKP